MNVVVPTAEERYRVVHVDGEADELETPNPAFYRIDLDSELLYRGTKFENEDVDSRPQLTLDFFEIAENLHRTS